MEDLIAWFRACLDDDEKAAKAATDPDRPGTHWHWVTTTTDTPVAPGDLAEAQQHQNVSLRTVEEFPASSGVGPLPTFLMYAEEVHSGAGDHIARHDPAAVLEDVAAKKKLLAALEDMAQDEYNPWAWNHIAILASAYRHRPGWKDKWEA